MRGGALPTARHVGVAPSIVNNNPETMERSRRSFPTAAGWFFRPRHGGFSWAKMSQTPLALILRDARTRVRALRHLFSPCARRMRTGESAARRRTVFGHFHLTMSNSHSRSRGAFLRPGFASLLRAPAKRVGGAPKNVRVLGGTPVGHAITRRTRRLRGALRPMTRQYTGRNNLTISMPGSRSVPIVSQTGIEPMKTALSLMLALITTTALTEPLPVPKPPGPGGSCRARTATSRAAHSARRHRMLRTTSRSRAMTRVVGMHCVGLVLLAKWTRAALAFAHRRAVWPAAALS